MKKFSFILPLILTLFALTGCGQQGYPMGQLTYTPQQQPQFAQPIAAAQYPAAQIVFQPGQPQQMQQAQPVYVVYDPRNPQQQPMQISAATYQMLQNQSQAPQQQPQQMIPDQMQGMVPQQIQSPPPMQVKMQNVGLQVDPKYKGMIAGCQLFQMEMDTGPVTMAKCKGFNGVPAFFQVSPTTLDEANLAKKDKATLIVNEPMKPDTEDN